MSVVLIGLGSRGDVQPLAVLGGELVRRGVPARVVALAEYAELAGRYGAAVEPVDAELAPALAMARRYRWVAGTLTGQGWLLRHWVRAVSEPFADAILRAVRPGDAVVGGVPAAEAAVAVAQAVRGRAATMLFTGQLPTSQPESHCFARWFTPWATVNRWATAASWRAATGLGAPLAGIIREKLGSGEPRRGAATAPGRHPIIVAASPTLVPPPRRLPPLARQTGYLAAPVEELPADLAAYLAGGAEPVFVGVGSFTPTTGAEGLALLRDVAVRSGRRLVTMAPTAADVGELDDGLFAVGDVSFEALFPRMAGVVHHGGAGSSQTGLRASRPSVAVPFGVDQPYHAARLAALGVGPEPVPFPRLDAPRLTRLIGDLVDGPAAPGFAARARHVGELVRAEDGVGATVRAMRDLGLLPA